VVASQARDVEVALGALAAGRAEATAKLRIVEEAAEGIGERVRIARRTSRPVSPSTTTSGTPPTALATTGRPAAIASRIEIGIPSESDESTKTSARASRSGTSLHSPSSVTPSMPSRNSACGPSPATSARNEPGSSERSAAARDPEALRQDQPADADDQRR